ncbi:MAG: response regulator transcription factor [Spirochaetales bacterium]|nr:response regulator transcription factor [Spirochaetales bacterium]
MKLPQRGPRCYHETMKILIVEDDIDISTLIQFHLNAQHYETVIADNGKTAIEKLRANEDISLVILDIMLPVVSGLEVLKYIRYQSSNRNLPVIITSALTEESDIITGLELGADDYLTKPFSPKILLARIRSVIRRSEGSGDSGKTIKTTNGIHIDAGSRLCYINEESISFTATEFDILLALIKAEGRVLTRAQIMEAIKGDDKAATERSIDVQIASIRKKLGPLGQSIATVWGIGYRYADE